METNLVCAPAFHKVEKKIQALSSSVIETGERLTKVAPPFPVKGEMVFCWSQELLTRQLKEGLDYFSERIICCAKPWLLHLSAY